MRPQRPKLGCASGARAARRGAERLPIKNTCASSTWSISAISSAQPLRRGYRLGSRKQELVVSGKGPQLPRSPWSPCQHRHRVRAQSSPCPCQPSEPRGSRPVAGLQRALAVSRSLPKPAELLSFGHGPPEARHHANSTILTLERRSRERSVKCYQAASAVSKGASVWSSTCRNLTIAFVSSTAQLSYVSASPAQIGRVTHARSARPSGNARPRRACLQVIDQPR